MSVKWHIISGSKTDRRPVIDEIYFLSSEIGKITVDIRESFGTVVMILKINKGINKKISNMIIYLDRFPVGTNISSKINEGIKELKEYINDMKKAEQNVAKTTDKNKKENTHGNKN